MAKELNKNELTKEQIEKAMACKTADELMKLAEAEGYSLTKDEAEAFLAELGDVELGEEALEKAAGGYFYRFALREKDSILRQHALSHTP